MWTAVLGCKLRMDRQTLLCPGRAPGPLPLKGECCFPRDVGVPELHPARDPAPHPSCQNFIFLCKGHEPELVCSATIKARYCSKRQSPVSAGHNDPWCPIRNCCPFWEKVTATTSTQTPPLLSDCKVRCRLPSSRCTLNHS